MFGKSVAREDHSRIDELPTKTTGLAGAGWVASLAVSFSISPAQRSGAATSGVTASRTAARRRGSDRNLASIVTAKAGMAGCATRERGLATLGFRSSLAACEIRSV